MQLQYLPSRSATPTQDAASVHGCSLADYHMLHTTRCFATGIALFLLHWAIYVRCIHTVPSRVLRRVLCAIAVGTYLLAVLHLHPWQPYWIRELSVMLVQLYAWKAADLALLRHGERLPHNFWSFILFDVLVLRPTALVLPWRTGHSQAPQPVDGAPANPAEASKRHRAANDEKALSLNGRVRAQGQPDVSGDGLQGAKAKRRKGHKAAAGASASGRIAGAHATAVAASHQRATAVRDLSNGSGALDVARQSRTGTGKSKPATGSRPRTMLGCGATRLQLAAAVVARPLLDFVLTYNACEAVNAYLMHRRAEDVLSASLLMQAWLSTCFATALYFHLRYFFYSMEMLWLVGFALFAGVRLPRWEPLFNSPEWSTSPVDFWNNRWHQAFRWWWTRLVFVPVRRALKHAIGRLAAHGAFGGHNRGSPDTPHFEDGAGDARVDDQHALCSDERCDGRCGRKQETRTSLGASEDHDPRKGRQRAAKGRGSGGAKARVTATADCRQGVQACEVLPSGSCRKRRGVAQRVSAWLVHQQEQLLLAVSTLAVFAFSALFHESLLLINFGQATGEQALFFMFHALMLLAQRAAERAAPRLCRAVAAAVPAPLRAAAFMGFMGLTSVIFFRPWFRSSYHRELRVLYYGPTGWAVRVWGLGIPRDQVRLL